MFRLKVNNPAVALKSPLAAYGLARIRALLYGYEVVDGHGIRNFSSSVIVASSQADADAHPSGQQKKKPNYTFQTLQLTKPEENIFHVQLNRPDRSNALNGDSWREIRQCFNTIAMDSECRVVILSGLGKHFCGGIVLYSIDLLSIQSDFANVMASEKDVARKALHFSHLVRAYQESFSAIEKCPQPVIASIHGGCIGAGIDMTSACDIRYCTEDAFFSIKEVDIGIAADVGTLQRFPKIVGNDSLVREYAFTGRRFASAEAKKVGFVSRLFDTRDAMMGLSMDIARQIASKSPVAIHGTKIHLNYSRDHTVQEGLDNMVNWQMSMLQTEDLLKAAMASADRSGKTVASFAPV